MEMLRETTERFTGQKLAVAVADQQQSKRLGHGFSSSRALISRSIPLWTPQPMDSSQA